MTGAKTKSNDEEGSLWLANYRQLPLDREYAVRKGVPDLGVLCYRIRLLKRFLS